MWKMPFWTLESRGELTREMQRYCGRAVGGSTLVVVYESRAQGGAVGSCRLSACFRHTCAGLEQPECCIYSELGFNQENIAEEGRQVT